MTTTRDIAVFARLRELAGAATVRVALPEPATVSAARAALAAALPAAAPLLPHCVFAVAGSLAPDDARLPAGVEIACLPPVSGG